MSEDGIDFGLLKKRLAAAREAEKPLTKAREQFIGELHPELTYEQKQELKRVQILEKRKAARLKWAHKVPKDFRCPVCGEIKLKRRQWVLDGKLVMCLVCHRL